MTDTTVEREAFGDVLTIGAAALATIFGLLLTIASPEPAMAFHGALLAIAVAIGGGVVLSQFFAERDRDAQDDYMDGPIKVATIAAIIWGIAGFLVGVIIAWQLALPKLNLDLPWTSFGRLRPLHTSAVIFAFGGNVLLATSFYVVQRTCHARLAGRWSPWFVVWGYQLFIVIAGTGYLLGVTQSKEYAEPE